ncbi:MAG: hypothetical protein FWG44_07260 [Oscillospiraceae bacterium]|nr:hypothetical protein [Oscillospiraceae bacterium]
MFCPKCGNNVPDGMVCGCTQAQPQQPVQQQMPPPPPPMMQQQMPPPQMQQQMPQQQMPPPMMQQQMPPQQFYAPPAPKDPKVGAAKLSYVFIFWLAALFNKEVKDDPLVRFHAGQGIMLSIMTAGLLAVRELLFSVFYYIGEFIAIIKEETAYGFSNNFFNGTAGFIIKIIFDSGILAFYIIFLLIGIGNASKKTLQPLPLFGKSAFYK